MNTRRKSIKIFDHERAVLVDLYLSRRIAIDQYEQRPEDLAGLVADWHRLTGRTDTGGQLIHYMRSQRKRGLWVTFDGVTPLPPPPAMEFTSEETIILTEIHAEFVTSEGWGSDVLAYDPHIAAFIAREFADRTGRIVPPHELIGKLTAVRKRGLLAKVADAPKKPEGFNDLKEAGGQ